MISLQHKTVFVHIPKCGGQSVEQAFLNHLGVDWKNRHVLTLLERQHGRIGPPRVAHLSAQQYIVGDYITSEDWDEYFTFAIVRDPIKRAVSHFNYRRPTKTLSEYVREWLPAQFTLAPHYADVSGGPSGTNPGQYHFVRPQVDFLTDANGAVMVDEIYRLEDIGARWSEIQERASLPEPLPYRNKSKAKATVDDLSVEEIDILVKLYAADYALLGYDPAPLRARAKSVPESLLSRLTPTLKLSERTAHRIGWGMSALFGLFMIGASAFPKLVGLDVAQDTMTALGWDNAPILLIGLLELASALLFLYPPTAVLGGVLMMAIFGGAIATQLRAGNPLGSDVLFSVYLGLLMWGGLWLRSPRWRSMFPARSPSSKDKKPIPPKSPFRLRPPQ